MYIEFYIRRILSISGDTVAGTSREIDYLLALRMFSLCTSHL